MSQQAELDKIESKIKALQNRKKLIEQKDKLRQRKILTKQKILLGGYLMKNYQKYLSQEQMLNLLSDLDNSISKTRKADIEAINQLSNDFLR